MKALYPGSFDPVTRGHMDIITRAAAVADQLIVAVLINTAKQPLFDIEERVRFLQELTADMPHVTVDSFTGLLSVYAREHGIDCILRGVRSAADFEYETHMARINRQLTGGIDTWLLPADAGFSHVSGSAVREIAYLLYHGGLDDAPLDTMVAPSVKDALRVRFKKQHG